MQECDESKIHHSYPTFIIQKKATPRPQSQINRSKLASMSKFYFVSQMNLTCYFKHKLIVKLLLLHNDQPESEKSVPLSADS